MKEAKSNESMSTICIGVFHWRLLMVICFIQLDLPASLQKFFVGWKEDSLMDNRLEQGLLFSSLLYGTAPTATWILVYDCKP